MKFLSRFRVADPLKEVLHVLNKPSERPPEQKQQELLKEPE